MRAIQLPDVQRNCLKALKAAGKKVVFINCAGKMKVATGEYELLYGNSSAQKRPSADEDLN